MRQQEPFSDTGTTWLFDYKHYAVGDAANLLI